MAVETVTRVQPDDAVALVRALELFRGEFASHERWHAWDFASQAAQAILAARPDPSEGERAAGVRDGLEAAARIVLALARVPEEDRGSPLADLEDSDADR